MAVKYVEVRKGVYRPKDWSPPKRIIDEKRLKEIIHKLLIESRLEPSHKKTHEDDCVLEPATASSGRRH